MDENVCRFLPNYKADNEINIINLVYETKCDELVASQKRTSTYRMHIVIEGEGILETQDNKVEIKKGDIFILPPAISFSIENIRNIKYIYISYLGIKANFLGEKFKLAKNGSVYRGFENLLPIWKTLFDVSNDLSNLRCESVLLYTFTEIGKRIFVDSPEKKFSSAPEKIKKLIDENFSNHSLNLEFLSNELSYHPKYISSVFKKEFNTSITDYIKIIRVQHACTLIEQGLTSVKNISTLCGFNDSLYFSTVFKAKMGIPPKEHIKKFSEHNKK